MSYPKAPIAQLTAHEIHVYWATLYRPISEVQALEHLLDQDERERASRYLAPPDRHRFILARGLLRILIGAYLEIDPDAVTFRYGPHGKPEVASAHFAGSLQFNASRSDDMALFGFTINRPIGVDVELVRADFDSLRLAERFLSPTEAGAIRALSPDERAAAFFSFWTVKEAFLKAEGVGLSHPVEDVEIVPPDNLLPQSTVRFAGDARSRNKSEHCSVFPVNTLPEYVANVVTRLTDNAIPTLTCLRWEL